MNPKHLTSFLAAAILLSIVNMTILLDIGAATVWSTDFHG